MNFLVLPCFTYLWDASAETPRKQLPRVSRGRRWASTRTRKLGARSHPRTRCLETMASTLWGSYEYWIIELLNLRQMKWLIWQTKNKNIIKLKIKTPMSLWSPICVWWKPGRMRPEGGLKTPQSVSSIASLQSPKVGAKVGVAKRWVPARFSPVDQAIRWYLGILDAKIAYFSYASYDVAMLNYVEHCWTMSLELLTNRCCFLGQRNLASGEISGPNRWMLWYALNMLWIQ